MNQGFIGAAIFVYTVKIIRAQQVQESKIMIFSTKRLYKRKWLWKLKDGMLFDCSDYWILNNKAIKFVEFGKSNFFFAQTKEINMSEPEADAYPFSFYFL